MTKESPTSILLKAKDARSWVEGDALDLIINGSICLQGATTDRKSRPVKLNRSMVGLFQEPHLGGCKYWLLISTVLDDGSHDGWVSHYEGDAHPVTWVGECTPRITTFKKTSPRYHTRLSKQVIAKISSSVPYQIKPWMTKRLIPRRHPAAIRIMPEKVIQVWVNL